MIENSFPLKVKEVCKMKTKEFFNAVNLIVKEKGIDKAGIFEAMELALVNE